MEPQFPPFPPLPPCDKKPGLPPHDRVRSTRMKGYVIALKRAM